MPSSKIKKLLVKYVSRSATYDDMERLEDWIRNAENIPIFRDYIKTQFAMQLSMNDPDPSEIKKRLLKEIRKDKRILRNRNLRKVLKYAAVALLFLGIGYFIKNGIFTRSPAEPIVPKRNAVTLRLENGEIRTLSENRTSEVKDATGQTVGTQQGNRLVYEDRVKDAKLSYNTLEVPFGKRFEIMLSDGTEVFLNSGSSFKYPVHFMAGKKRQVFLEGEAFLEVSHDTENPFFVISQGLEVQVLGTKFNVSNYEEDRETEVVLVNGSVQMASLEKESKDNQTLLLEPGFKGSFDKSKKNITKKEVNTSLYTSWVKGQVIFRNSTFENIRQKLERHYNVVIINNNKELEDETFNASIDVDNESMEEVLEYFNKIYGIDYELVNNKIIIN